MKITDLLRVPFTYLGSDYESPNDGSVAYTSGTTLTCSGFPFTIADTNCTILGLRVTNTAGKRKYYFDDSGSQIKLTSAANVITISGAGLLKTAPFSATDTEYKIWIKAQKKGYDAGTNLYRIKEQSPLNSEVISDVIIDTTDVAVGTNYYPSSDGLDMLGYKRISIQGAQVSDCLVTIEVTNDTSVTKIWHSITPSFWDDISNSDSYTGFGGAGVVTTFCVDKEIGYHYVRLAIVTYDATNIEEIYMRRLY